MENHEEVEWRYFHRECMPCEEQDLSKFYLVMSMKHGIKSFGEAPGY